jgi:hypothetical protein
VTVQEVERKNHAKAVFAEREQLKAILEAARGTILSPAYVAEEILASGFRKVASK